MISKGLILMVLGMAIVFVLLAFLVLFMNIARLIVTGGRKKQAAAAAGGNVAGGGDTADREIAAVAAAVTVYNAKRMSV